MYYKLKPPYSFRGWRKLPYAIRAEYGEQANERPRFFKKALFKELLHLNGVEDVEPTTMSAAFQQVLKEFLENDYAEAADEPLGPLMPWQRYRVYPARYAESVHWAITGKCNFRCRHCLVSAPDARHPQLPLSDLEHIADEIARCGIKFLEITGGEPLVRKDFPEFVEMITKRDLHIRMIFTNASLLDKKVLDTLDSFGQHPGFQLSFDGLGHHDWLRGVPGAEVQADAAFRLLQERGVPVDAAVMVHRENRDCLRDTARYLADLGVRAMRTNAPQELGVWKEYASDYALTNEELWDVYREFIPQYFEDGSPIDVDLDGFFSCKKGSTDYKVSYQHHLKEDSDWSKLPYCESMRYHMHIRPDGRVAPCMGFSDTVLGNRFPSVLEEHLGDILLDSYYHDVVDTKLSDLLAKSPECAECEHWTECVGGCMLNGMGDDGNYLVPDPQICWFHKHVGEATVRGVADAALAKLAQRWG